MLNKTFKVKKLSSIIMLLFFSSYLNAQSFTGPLSLLPGTNGVYTASNTATNYYWSTTGGLTIVGSNTSNSVTVTMGRVCGTLYLVAYSQNSSSNYCFNKEICSPPTPPACIVNSGVIKSTVCSTYSHPWWRLNIDGYTGQSNYTFEWSSDHFNFRSGRTSSSIIGNPTDIINGQAYGFTLYCKVTKTCSGGEKISRTFYYQSRGDNPCSAGITGEFGGGGNPIDPDLARISISEEPVKLDALSSYPNPFNEETKIKYYAKNSANVNVLIYNKMGQLILNPVKNKLTKAGYNEVLVTKSDLGEKGIYFVKLFLDGELVKTNKIYLN
jgi:hypothetical protein